MTAAARTASAAFPANRYLAYVLHDADGGSGRGPAPSLGSTTIMGVRRPRLATKASGRSRSWVRWSREAGSRRAPDARRGGQARGGGVGGIRDACSCRRGPATWGANVIPAPATRAVTRAGYWGSRRGGAAWAELRSASS